MSPIPPQRPLKRPSSFHPTHPPVNSKTAPIQPPILHKFPHPISRPPNLPPSLLWSCSARNQFVDREHSQHDPPISPRDFWLYLLLGHEPMGMQTNQSAQDNKLAAMMQKKRKSGDPVSTKAPPYPSAFPNLCPPSSAHPSSTLPVRSNTVPNNSKASA